MSAHLYFRPSSPERDNRGGIFVTEAIDHPLGRRGSSGRLLKSLAHHREEAVCDPFCTLDHCHSSIITSLLAAKQKNVASAAGIILENPHLAEEIYEVAITLDDSAARRRLLRVVYTLTSAALDLLPSVVANGTASAHEKRAFTETAALLRCYRESSRSSVSLASD